MAKGAHPCDLCGQTRRVPLLSFDRGTITTFICGYCVIAIGAAASDQRIVVAVAYDASQRCGNPNCKNCRGFEPDSGHAGFDITADWSATDWTGEEDEDENEDG